VIGDLIGLGKPSGTMEVPSIPRSGLVTGMRSGVRNVVVNLLEPIVRG
jgi:hypothetical protein